MILFSKIFRKITGRPKEVDSLEKFRSWIKLSLKTLEKNSPDCSDSTLLRCLEVKGIPTHTAKLIIDNLSSSFCQKLVKDLKLRPNQVAFSFSNLEVDQNQSLSEEKYKVMEEETENYYQNNPESDLIANLASRSFENYSLNQLM